MAKVIGIGGIFAHFHGDTKALYEWYEENLGLDFSAYGTGFLDGEQLMVLTFKRDDNPNMPYLNFRVDDIDAIMTHLKTLNIEVLSDVKDYEYGKFASIKDPFGNPIELWEAYKDQYKALVEQEIKSYKTNKTPKI